MKLTSKKALQMLEDTRKDFENQGWIDHSICVGNSAGKITRALNSSYFFYVHCIIICNYQRIFF